MSGMNCCICETSRHSRLAIDGNLYMLICEWCVAMLATMPAEGGE